MNVRVSYTSTGRKLWIVTDTRKVGQRLERHMYLNFGVAEEMIHYGLHHLRHDTEDGPFVLPKELRRREPVKTLQDLFRRKMLLPDEEKLGPIKRLHHCPQVEFDLYWSEVYNSGLYNLTPFGLQVLQAVKEFFLADPHGAGILPLYSLDRETITDEEKAKIQAACDHWGVRIAFIAGKSQGNVGLADIHAHLTPAEGTWWLRQFHRFEDRLHLFLPTEPRFEGLNGECTEGGVEP